MFGPADDDQNDGGVPVQGQGQGQHQQPPPPPAQETGPWVRVFGACFFAIMPCHAARAFKSIHSNIDGTY